MTYNDEDDGYDEDNDVDYDVDYDVFNVQSGWAHNSVQAGAIHGDVNFYGDGVEEREYFSALPWGFSVAIYAVLFMVSTAYALAIDSMDLSFWDWTKLVVSTLLLIPVFAATEYRLHGIEFLALRLLGTVLIVALAVSQGLKVTVVRGLVALLARWLVWRF